MAGEVHELDLKTEAKGYGGRHNLRLGADYDFGKKNLLSVVYNTQYRYGQDCLSNPKVVCLNPYEYITSAEKRREV